MYIPNYFEKKLDMGELKNLIQANVVVSLVLFQVNISASIL